MPPSPPSNPAETRPRRTPIVPRRRPTRPDPRVRSKRAFALPVFLAIAVPLFAQEQPAETPNRRERIDALAQLSDPARDDWPTEILQRYAKHQLEQLEKNLVRYATQPEQAATDLRALFSPRVRMTALLPDLTPTHTYDGMRVRRASAALIDAAVPIPPPKPIDDLMRPFRNAAGLRIAFKIIGVHIPGPNTFATRVLYQAFAHTKNGPMQQNAEWVITWLMNPDMDQPRIEAVRLNGFHDVLASKPRFIECTRSIITDDDLWRKQLLRGGEHWYGKIDAVGEINYLGHQGIAVGDVNGDGLDDLYVAMGTGLPNKLFIQNPDGSATETADPSGVAWLDDTKGVLLLDVDNDGDQDLLAAMGPSIVYCENDATGRFTPLRKLRAATDASFYSLSAADFDLDGDLDVYATRYVTTRYGESVPMPFHDANNGPPNHLLRNDGQGGFSDVTYDLGVNAHNTRFSLAAAWADYDADGDPDLYVANDFGRNNLYRNDNGRFVDVAPASGTEDQAAGMGVAWSDFDLDGDLDLYVSNMFSSAGQRIAYRPRFKQGQPDDVRRQVQRHSLGNSLFTNAGGGAFNDVGQIAGVRMGRWSWGAKFVDFDNDGYDDIVVPNGFLTNERPDDL